MYVCMYVYPYTSVTFIYQTNTWVPTKYLYCTSNAAKTYFHNFRSVWHNLKNIVWLTGHAATQLCYKAALQESICNNEAPVSYYT